MSGLPTEDLQLAIRTMENLFSNAINLDVSEHINVYKRIPAKIIFYHEKLDYIFHKHLKSQIRLRYVYSNIGFRL